MADIDQDNFLQSTTSTTIIPSVEMPKKAKRKRPTKPTTDDLSEPEEVGKRLKLTSFVQNRDTTNDQPPTYEMIKDEEDTTLLVV
jgi:hypothetical protein